MGSIGEQRAERAVALARRLAETGLNLEQEVRDLVGALQRGGGGQRLRDLLDRMARGQASRSGDEATERAVKLRQAIVSAGILDSRAAAGELAAGLRLLPWFRSRVRPRQERPTRERAERDRRGRGGPGARPGGPPRAGAGGRGRP